MSEANVKVIRLVPEFLFWFAFTKTSRPPCASDQVFWYCLLRLSWVRLMEKKATNDAFKLERQTCCNEQSCCGPQTPFTRVIPKVGRNDPCPCGNGKKFKKCCGRGAWKMLTKKSLVPIFELCCCYTVFEIGNKASTLTSPSPSRKLFTKKSPTTYGHTVTDTQMSGFCYSSEGRSGSGFFKNLFKTNTGSRIKGQVLI